MRDKIKDPSRILHIKKAIEKIDTFLDNKSKDDLKDESVLFYAIVKNLEIIGEAIYMLTDTYKEEHPDIPWRDFEKLRHVLVHGYYTINHEIVYDICIKDIPNLKIQVKEL